MIKLSKVKKIMISTSRLNQEHNLPGTLICVEGIDGSGKSTIAKLLLKYYYKLLFRIEIPRNV